MGGRGRPCPRTSCIQGLEALAGLWSSQQLSTVPGRIPPASSQRSPPGPPGPPGSCTSFSRRLPQGMGELLLPPSPSPASLGSNSLPPWSKTAAPHCPPRGRAHLFRCCLPVSREHTAQCAVSPQTGAPPPRDHLSLSAWDWEGSQDEGHRALNPSRFPEACAITHPRGGLVIQTGPSPCPCVQEQEGLGHF